MELMAQLIGILNESNDPCEFSRGFDDCEQGLSPQSENESYMAGYGYAYELGERNGSGNA